MKMLVWYIGIQTQFSPNPGKLGKYFIRYLEPELREMLQKTYSVASYDSTRETLFTTCSLFRMIAVQVAEHFGFDYPRCDDERVSAHLKHVQGCGRIIYQTCHDNFREPGDS